MTKLNKGVKQLVDEALAEVVTLSDEEAADLHKSGGATFIDIRDIRELYREGMIEGAYHAPRGMLEFWVDPDSPYHRDIFATDKKLVLVLSQWLAVSFGSQGLARYGDGQCLPHFWWFLRLEEERGAHRSKREKVSGQFSLGVYFRRPGDLPLNFNL